jgi:hypothetical protein
LALIDSRISYVDNLILAAYLAKHELLSRGDEKGFASGFENEKTLLS